MDHPFREKPPYKIFLLIVLLFLLCIPTYIYATGGAFQDTKHGGGTTDGETPCAGGVNRGLGVDYGGNCTTAATANAYHSNNSEAGTYMSGECGHCHEPHAMFGATEPAPSGAGDAGPDPYLVFKEYGASANYANLCWYCHENISNINSSGSPITMGRWSFYQGQSVYTASSHYLSPNFFWPGTGETSGTTPKLIWPRSDRSWLPLGNKGSCLNCHTPHGIKAADAANAYDITSPDGTGGVPATAQTTATNPSVMSDYMIPRQLISWEENLCERCHDGSPASTNIQDEINKRYLPGGSGHPVDDTTLAGRHVASEPLPITTKHVECYDCHNPHAVKAPTGALNDGDGGRVKGMKYVDINGTVQNPATLGGTREPYIYEICLKCHGNTYDQVFAGSSKVYPTETIYRPPGMSNKRLEFDSTSSDATYGPPGTNSAYHPVASAGKNTTLALCLQLQAGGFPDLTCTTQPSPNLSSLTINCTDCHNSEMTGAGTTTVMGPVTQSNLRASDRVSVYAGASPVGPHGSQALTPSLKFNIGVNDNGDRSILRDYYFTGRLPPDRSPFIAPSSATEFQNRFKLCFNCHDWNTFYGNNNNTNFYGTGFVTNLHAFHLRAFNAGVIWLATYEACATCHYNVHSNVQATNTGYDSSTGGFGSLPPDGDTHLVNFAPGVVSALNYSKPAWYSDGSTMYCNLRCHGIQMNYSYNCQHNQTTAGTGVSTNTCND